MEPYRTDLENQLKQSPFDDTSLDRLIHAVNGKKRTVSSKRLWVGAAIVSVTVLLATGIAISPAWKTLAPNSAANVGDIGDFIIRKENNRILVASNISERDVKTELSRLMEKRTKLVWYTVDDLKLVEDIHVGEKVTVKPKTFIFDGKEVSIIADSYPQQAAAGEILRESKNPNEGPKTIYPMNKNGQTYGSAADADSPENEPDLIKAIGVDGTEGYVRKTDLVGELPNSPEEALEMQKNRPPGGRDIPLYDVDGETVIGLFHIS